MATLRWKRHKAAGVFHEVTNAEAGTGTDDRLNYPVRCWAFAVRCGNGGDLLGVFGVEKWDSVTDRGKVVNNKGRYAEFLGNRIAVNNPVDIGQVAAILVYRAGATDANTIRPVSAKLFFNSGDSPAEALFHGGQLLRAVSCPVDDIEVSSQSPYKGHGCVGAADVASKNQAVVLAAISELSHRSIMLLHIEFVYNLRIPENSSTLITR